jgi:tetratricopeptide (TPR) repeat protein
VRYTVAQAVRDFAAERLAASGEEHAVRAAHAAHVAAVGETFRGTGTPDIVVARVFALEAEFRAALAWTREHAPALHTRVAAALGLVLNDGGRAGEAHAELGLAIERSGVTDATGGWAAVVRAFAAVALGLRSEAPLMEAGLAALRAADDTPRYVLALRVAGVYWRFLEEFERALEHTTEALALARGRPHLGDLAMALVDHATILIELERLNEAEALLDEAAPLIPQLGASDVDADTFFDELAAARGDWAHAARLFLANAQTTRSPGLKGMLLRHTAIALAHLGADEDALELAATANAICESIGEAPSDPLTTRYGSALDEARERLGPERSAHAARRGAALPEGDSITRAAGMVQTACAARAR